VLLAEALESARSRIDGAKGLWLVGLDGVIVAGSGNDPGLREEWLAASFTDIFRRVCSAGGEADLAAPAEMTVSGPSGVVVVRPLGDDHALLAVVAADAIPGRARYQLRLVAEQVKAELLA